MNKGFIDNVTSLGLWPRLLAFHAGMMMLGVLYALTEPGFVSVIAGSMMVGMSAAGMFHHFRPFSITWAWWKSLAIKLTHGVAILLVLYVALWGKFLGYGSFVSEDMTWAARVAGFMLAGFGFVVAGVVLGKGRFEPDMTSTGKMAG